MTVDEYEFRTKLIALEIETCKQLASNNVKVRKKGLRRLRDFLTGDHIEKSEAEDFNRIWVGLFTYVWMSDTPLVQEADVEEISSLIHRIRNFNAVLLFVRGFFTTITNQWDRISHHRTDKFLMFIRRFLRQIFFLLKNSEWNSEKVEKLSSEFYSAIQIFPVQLTQHFNDIYNEELAKVSEGSIPTDALILLLKCFVDCVVQQKPSKAVVNHINTNIFCSLVRQLKLLIKQQAAVQLDSEMFSLEEPDMEGSANLDPRPGNAHVFLPYIEFDEKKIVEFLKQSISAAQISHKAKNIITQNIRMFESITRLRQSMTQPKKVLGEVNDKGRKRKKKTEKFRSLVKKACRRLDDADDYFGTKKMKKLIRSNTWEISQNVDTSAKTSVAQDWTVNDLRKKGPVSFSGETDSLTYEMDSSQPSRKLSVPIVVPKSACNDRPGILKSDENYAVVDFGDLKNDSECTENAAPLADVRSEDTAYTEPPWTPTEFKGFDSEKTPIKEFSIDCSSSIKTETVRRTRRRSSEMSDEPLRRSTRRRSSSVESYAETPKRRTSVSTKTPKIIEEAEPGPEESDSVRSPVKNEKIKPSKCRKSKTLEAIDEIPDEDEKTAEPIKKSIVQRTKFEPRKTRSGRVYNV